MARQRKRNARSFPTFRREIRTLRRQPRPRESARDPDMKRLRHGTEKVSLLQLALERFDLFGERHILGDQRLDLAHGVQHRGVVASAEPAPDFGQ